jgi:DNA-binding transcriptional LysR family regulator
MLDVHRLRVFRSVVASGSIQAAATNLGYTASAVSQHVSALQRETGLSLVTRIGRGIEPTAAGLALATEIDGVLSRLGDVQSFVDDLRTGRTGTMSLAYFASVGSAWMPTVIRHLVTEFPDVRLRLSLRDDLPTGPAERPDLQVVVEQDHFESAVGARIHHLLDDPYLVVLPRHHPLAKRRAVELIELATQRWVDNDIARGWCRRNLIEACQAAGFTPPFHVEAHDYQTAIAFVDAGIGLTVMPRLAARNLPAGVTTLSLTGVAPKRSIYALVATGVEGAAPVQAALKVLRACARSSRSPNSSRRS